LAAHYPVQLALCKLLGFVNDSGSLSSFCILARELLYILAWRTQHRRSEMENRKCQLCGREDSAINPVLRIANATEFDEEWVCKDCVSQYDGTFAWSEDGEVIFI